MLPRRQLKRAGIDLFRNTRTPDFPNGLTINGVPVGPGGAASENGRQTAPNDARIEPFHTGNGTVTLVANKSETDQILVLDAAILLDNKEKIVDWVESPLWRETAFGAVLDEELVLGYGGHLSFDFPPYLETSGVAVVNYVTVPRVKEA